MTRESQLEFCRICVNQQKDLSLGIICSLNGQVAEFDENCDSFQKDSSLRARTSGNKGSKRIGVETASLAPPFSNYLIRLVCIVIILSCVAFSFAWSKAGDFQSKSELHNTLVGKHMFGVQFIWDGYGTAEISKENGVLKIIGEQYSNDKEEYVMLDGTISVIDERNFMVKGHLKLFTEACCGLLDREINYTFRKTGNRKYYRLKEREELCSQYTCAYYLDIFE